MGLILRSFNDVFASLVTRITSRTSRLTDFNVGSALRTMCEAVGIQFEEFYYAIKQNVLFAIETAIYDAFGFPIRQAQPAEGYVTIDFTEPLADTLFFPAGTVFCTSSVYGYLYFESTENIYAVSDSICVMVPVRCKTPGEIGNIPAGAITTIVTTNSIIKRVYNETAFASGSNLETGAERKRRFQQYIRTLSKATRDALIYGTLEIEGVAGAWCDDNYIGFVKLYAHDANGDLPDDLKRKIQENLQNYRAAGIEVQILPIVKRPIDISVMIMIENEYDPQIYNALIKELIDRMLNEHVVSQPFYAANMIHAIKDAYENVVVNIRIIQGSDTEIQNNEIIRAGNVNVHCVTVRDWHEYTPPQYMTA